MTVVLSRLVAALCGVFGSAVRRGSPSQREVTSQIGALPRRKGEHDCEGEEAAGTMSTHPGPAAGPAEPGLGVVVAERRRLLNVAYRLLGSLTEAEDVVQETYTRWYALDEAQRAAIDPPGAWLTRVASRICLDLLRSARARRERYVGEWIPEPVPGQTEWVGGRAGATGDPADRVTLDESVTLAFLVVLESMTPAERVAFILHDVFGYPFAEVAGIVGRTPAACRQLAASARRRVRDSRVPAGPAELQADLVRRFRLAWETQDIDALVRLLDPDVTVVADGGGLVNAQLHPIEGRPLVIRAVLEIAGQAPGVTLLERLVNGQPGLVMRQDGTTVTVLGFHLAGDRIRRIWAVRNPEKLRHWAAG